MDLQLIIVMIAIASATAFVGSIIYRKTRSFSSKRSCGGDCGCNETSKKLHS